MKTHGPYIECSQCHERIRSEFRHDFRYCSCKATFVDGGSAYLRVGGRPVLEDGKIKTFSSKRMLDG